MSHPEFRPRDVYEALAHVVEEMAESLAAVAKTQRFGLLSTNPLLPPDQRETNAAWVARELSDLEQAIDTLRQMANLPRAPRDQLFVGVATLPDGSRVVAAVQSPDGSKRTFSLVGEHGTPAAGHTRLWMDNVTEKLFAETHTLTGDNIAPVPWMTAFVDREPESKPEPVRCVPRISED